VPALYRCQQPNRSLDQRAARGIYLFKLREVQSASEKQAAWLFAQREVYSRYQAPNIECLVRLITCVRTPKATRPKEWETGLADLNLTDIFLAGMTTYGPLTLGVAMWLGTLGIPVPLPILALAAGAFARHGSLNWAVAMFAALAGATLGDSLGYAVGRFAGEWAERRFGKSPGWARAEARFHRKGWLAIYITRFLLTPLAVPTNLIAGGSGYPYRRFLLLTLAGTLTFLLFFGGTGYAFARQWRAVGEFVTSSFGWLVGATIVGILIYVLIRRWYRNKRSRVSRQAASDPNQ
jgi:membrane-associated protein